MLVPPPKKERPATEKQIAYIRSFGVEPKPEMTIGEASSLLDQLINDPQAQDRKMEIEMRRIAERYETWQRTPAPSGIADRATMLVNECKSALPWLPVLMEKTEDQLHSKCPNPSLTASRKFGTFETQKEIPIIYHNSSM